MPEHHTKISFPVVGIGASAGGLLSFKKLVQNITEGSGMAYLLVQHLAPTHESLLPEILQRETVLPVHEITDAINLAPDHIYIIPENKMLTAFDGKLKLDPKPEGGINLMIDVFFNSLAEVHNSFSRGVLLSGTGFDGTLGLKAIKEQGGCTFVQNPDSATFDSMPLSAIRAGAADFVMEAEDIPLKLQQIDVAYENNLAYADSEQYISKTDEDTYRQIITLLKLRTGNDFSNYKQPTIRRRIARRMVITKMRSAAAYVTLLRGDTTEQDNLFNDILIPVSYFFRDTGFFDTLKETLFPDILKNKEPKDSLRIWVAGCSTGEEAYSIAILVHECMGNAFPDLKIQIFASDISENVISKARTGIYNIQEVQNVSDTRLRTYFNKVDGVYHIKKEIREMCIFAAHNLIKDPPFAKMDVISCRNVMIYLNPLLQKKAFSTFHYALKKSGILLLGKSESSGAVPNLFEPFIKNQKIFRRKNTADKFAKPATEDYDTRPLEREQLQLKNTGTAFDYYKLANEILFSEYTPAGIIINKQKDIVHFHANTEPFLFQPPGKPNYNVFKMLREGLAFEVRNALLKAKTTNAKVVKENITLKDREYTVNFEIIPLGNADAIHYLILFKQMMAATALSKGTQRKVDSERIKQLEAELNQMREDIQRVTEDQEASNEELQSANEELLSNSEELQTLNEELENSTEELRSNNAELTSVNEELQDRQQQLSTARLYSEAIIETIREPLLVLNRDLRIRSANASFFRYFNTSENDIEGKSLFDISNGVWDVPKFREQLLRVLPENIKLDNVELETDTPGEGLRTLLLNIRPMINNGGQNENLILVAIEDITSIRAANIALLNNNRELEDNNKELSSFSYVASHDLQEPLRKIHAFAKMMADDTESKISEESATYIERILVSTSRMQRLIEDLLHYSHIGKLHDNEFEQSDFTTIVKDALNDFADAIESTGAKVSVTNLPTVKLIPPLVYQVLLNLIGNALKYRNSHEQPTLNISYEQVNIDKAAHIEGKSEIIAYYKITIADNGIGFPQEQAERIFEPFQRLHGKDKYEGTGIGLAICKKIMIRHKGHITAQSIPGEGSKFNLYFPV